MLVHFRGYWCSFLVHFVYTLIAFFQWSLGRLCFGFQLFLSLRCFSYVFTMGLGWNCRFICNFSIVWNTSPSIWIHVFFLSSPYCSQLLRSVWFSFSLVSWLRVGVGHAVSGLCRFGLSRVFLLPVTCVVLVGFGRVYFFVPAIGRIDVDGVRARNPI